MSDVLKKPVHLAILRPSHLQQLVKEGRLPDYVLSVPTPEKQPLPQEPKKARRRLPTYNIPEVAARGAKLREEHLLRSRVRLFHKNAPKSAPAPCDECSTAACCVAFLVNLTPDEYNSGLYGEYAVKLTVKDAKAIGMGRIALLATMHVISVHTIKDEDHYYLEGPIGVSCPLLQNGRCSIYDQRPMTCRTYSCADDERITQGMRDGTADIELAMLTWTNAD